MIKIAGLMPIAVDLEKSLLREAIVEMRNTCDAVILLHDSRGVPAVISQCVTEQLWVEGGDEIWDDRANRMVLLARAAKYGCNFVMWLDDDELLGPSFTHKHVHELCEQADAQGHVAIMAKVKTAWNKTHWRTDGIFGRQVKVRLQLNPLMLKNPNFQVERRLHALPRLEGTEMWLPESDFVIHWGLRAKSLREKNVAKYLAADPENKFSEVRYDYLLDESGMTLEPL